MCIIRIPPTMARYGVLACGKCPSHLPIAQNEPYGPCLPDVCVSFESHPLWPSMDLYHVDNVPVIYQPTQYEPYGPCLPGVCVSSEKCPCHLLTYPIWTIIDITSQYYVYHLNPPPYGPVWTSSMWMMSLSSTNPPNMNHYGPYLPVLCVSLEPHPLWPSMDF